MLASFEHHLRRAEQGLRGELRGDRARQAGGDAAIAEGLDDLIRVGRAAAAEAGDGVEQGFFHGQRNPDGGEQFLSERGISGLQKAMFSPDHLPTPALPPQDAVRQLVRNNVDYLPIDQVFGRIATTLFVVYPPGIASIVPGERLDERARPVLDYLLAFEKSANLFPGFDVEIQGISRETDADGRVRFHTYVVRE